MPPTLKALLAARLDQLDERGAAGARAGRSRGRDLPPRRRPGARAGGDPGDARLAALVRHQLVRPDRAQLAGDDGYRFRHLLIRDAAYDALPKAVRAELHARFADWLDEHGDDLVELRRDRRLPPRAGSPLPGRARAARSDSRRTCRRAARCRWTARGRARRLSGGACAPDPGGGATSRDPARSRARAPSRLAHGHDGRPSGGRSSRRCRESRRTRGRSLRGPARTCDGASPPVGSRRHLARRGGGGVVQPGTVRRGDAR